MKNLNLNRLKQKGRENKGGVRNNFLWGRRAYQFVRFQGLGDSFFSQN
jgi:hypothetical protein